MATGFSYTKLALEGFQRGHSETVWMDIAYGRR